MWLEHEEALVEPRVGDGQPWLLDCLGAVEEQVEVDRPRAVPGASPDAPQALLDPLTRAALPADLLRSIGSTIAGGLLWVFAVMVAFAVVCVAVSSMMSSKRSEEPVSAADALEAVAG